MAGYQEERLPSESGSRKRESFSDLNTRKSKRTRTGCLTCRMRKVKCDETVQTCLKCERMGLECRWPAVHTLTSVYTGANPQPATTSTDGQSNRIPACTSCRAARSRCSRERPECARCRDNQLSCSYQSVPNGPSGAAVTPPLSNVSSNWQPSASRTRTTPSRDLTGDSIAGIPRLTIDQHVEAFFTYVYPCQANAFVHRGTLIRSIHDGSADKALILAICAVSARFVGPNTGQSRKGQTAAKAQSWSAEAKTMLVLNEELTMDSVAAALLLAKHDINNGRYVAAWMQATLAIRAALALDLHKGSWSRRTAITWVEQETGRRLLWACYCLDRMMSTGNAEFVILRAEHIKVQLPCEEHQYLLGVPCVTLVPSLESDIAPVGDDQAVAKDIGILGHYVQVMGMRYMVISYTRHRSKEQGQLPPWDQASIFNQCLRKISTWYDSLLPQFQLQSDTIYARQSQDQLSLLIMLHVLYDQCMADLYRIALPGFPESLPTDTVRAAPPGWIEQNQSLCIRHARNITATVDAVANHFHSDTLEILDSTFPMCAFESMRVQVQWFFVLSSQAQANALPELQERLTKMMDYVRHMTKYFRQAEWNLQEMHKMLRRHGIMINNMDGDPHQSGSQTPNHPWTKRMAAMAESPAMNAVGRHPNDTDRPSPAQKVPGHLVADRDDYADAIRSDINSTKMQQMAMLDDVSPESMAPLVSPSGIADEDLDALLRGYDQQQVIPDISNFFGILDGWTASEVDGNFGLDGPTHFGNSL